MRAPALFLFHGAGPLPLLSPESQGGLPSHLKALGPCLQDRTAVLIVSGHWEEEVATITSAAEPPLIYDYSGFGKSSLEIEFKAPGSPEVASRVVNLLREKGIAATATDARGWDHGVFVPLKLMLDGADIPVLQLSLLKSLDPEAHLQLGRALASLRDDNIVIIGSGASYHNMRGFGGAGRAAADSREFHDWLKATCCSASESARWNALAGWSSAPKARECHPREEHFLPLLVSVGAAGSDAGRVIFDETVMGVESVSFCFGDLE